MYLPLWIKLRKNKKPPCLSGQWERKKGVGVWGVSVGGYMLAVVVCAYVGFGWNTGNDCSSWSHI